MNKLILIFTTLVLFGFNNLSAQSSSTYTRFGIGDVVFSTSAKTIGLGQLGVSITDNASISTLNPAAWYNMKATQFGVNIAYNGLSISDGSNSGFYSETEFKGFTFGFPVSQDLGIGVATGLIPYSRVSYKVREVNSSEDIYTIDYEGLGGISEIFLGSSVMLPGNLALGASLNYYFGNISYSTNLTFTDQSLYPAEFEKIYKTTGFGTTVGIISPDISKMFSDSSAISNFKIGASLNIIPELNSDSIFISRSVTIEDTIVTGNSGMKLPYRVITGLSFIVSSKYLFTLDYTYQPWSEYEYNNTKKSSLRDLHKISTGFEYRPRQIPGATPWEQIVWRAGLSFEKTHYVLNNRGIDQFSVFGGFSFPLGTDNSIDIAVQYSMRGTTEAGLLKEDIIKLNLGISFSELWFLRFNY